MRLVKRYVPISVVIFYISRFGPTTSTIAVPNVFIKRTSLPPESKLENAPPLRLSLATSETKGAVAAITETEDILVVGSVNADTILSVDRLPAEGENLTLLPGTYPECDIPGGKGCNQAIACARLSKGCKAASDKSQHSAVSFIGQFGNDDVAKILEQTFIDNNVDISLCGHCATSPSGRGFVFLQPSGKVSAIVSGGSNVGGWAPIQHSAKQSGCDETHSVNFRKVYEWVRDRKVIMLQREVPEYINMAVARAVLVLKKHSKESTVSAESTMTSSDADQFPILIQDVGGEDRPISQDMLSMCDYIMPNRSELTRLFATLTKDEGFSANSDSLMNNELTDDHVIVCARHLQKYGAKNVLVTLGDDGCLLLRTDGSIVRQSACPLPVGLSVLDETGAGDCFRAAFAVASSEGQSISSCLEFASAAGALSVTRRGAVPSIPFRDEVERLYDEHYRTSYHPPLEVALREIATLRGGKSHIDDGSFALPNNTAASDDDDLCPLMFGSRLNSMKDRPELWNGPQDVMGWVARQGSIVGLGCVDFNFPQHFQIWTNQDAKAALNKAGLVAGAVCLRYPHDQFQQGAMTHPDPKVRQAAVDLTKQAAQAARDLDCDEVVVWSAYDGYDYPFQVDYDKKWEQIVLAFQECCDEYPDIKFSLEYKPTDENTRFFTVPSTGAALLLVYEIDRPNMGLTLDVGHMLMSGENPAQSIAMARKKLFGIQLNDGYTRLAAEDGLMFGSVHRNMALETIFHLQRIGYGGHLYFDTFPQRTDPVKEAEYNIRQVKLFWKAAKILRRIGIPHATANHDAIAALGLIDKAFALASTRE